MTPRAALALMLLAAACGGTPAAAPPSNSAVASPTAVPTPSVSPTPSPADASPSPTASPTAQPVAFACTGRPTGAPMAIIGDAVYDVGDAVHPHLLCRFSNTAAHLFTADTLSYLRPSPSGTYIVLHSMGSGNESTVADLPLGLLTTQPDMRAWAADGTLAATAVETTGPDFSEPTIHVSLYYQRGVFDLEQFPVPIGDCICRFGLAPFVMSFSPDGEYLAVGWAIGKGAVPISVFRVADRTSVVTFDPSFNFAMWAPSGHRLYVTSQSASKSWAPERTLTDLPGATGWAFEPSLDPGGQHVAYTAYVDAAAPTSIRVFVYDAVAGKTRMLINKLRSDVTFVKPGWVWYREEAACDTNASTCAPWGTAPTQRVFAMQLSTGVETPVVFAAGQKPSDLQTGWTAAEFWPRA